MTDLVVNSQKHIPATEMWPYQMAHIHGVTDWIQPEGAAPVAEWFGGQSTASSGTDLSGLNLSAVQSGTFEIESASFDNFELTFEGGEASIGAAVLVTDESRTVTLSEQADFIPIHIGWNPAATDQIQIGRESDFGDYWLSTELIRVETDSSGITGATGRLQPGLSNGRRRDDLSLDSFDTDVDFNGNQLQQARLWTLNDTPTGKPLRQPYVTTGTLSGADDLRVFLEDRDGAAQEYRIPVERVTPTIEDWETGSAGNRWTLNPNHAITSPGLNGSQFKLSLNGFGNSISESGLTTRPRPGEWFRFYFQYRNFNTSASLSVATVDFGGDVEGGNHYQAFINHRDGQSERIAIQKLSGGQPESTLVGFDNVPYLALDDEFRIDLYWPDDGTTDWQAELYDGSGSLLEAGTPAVTDAEYGEGDLRVKNPGGSNGVRWDFDEAVIPAREDP